MISCSDFLQKREKDAVAFPFWIDRDKTSWCSNVFFDEADIVLGCFRKVFKLGALGDIFFPAGEFFIDWLCFRILL